METETEFTAAEARVREVAGAQTQAATGQAVAARKVPEARDAAARAGATLQRLVIARNELDGEERRVRERLSDLGARLPQLPTAFAAGTQSLVPLSDEERREAIDYHWPNEAYPHVREQEATHRETSHN